MGFSIADEATQAKFSYISDNANEIRVVNNDPSSYSQITSAVTLADAVVASADFSTSTSAGNRLLTLAEEAGITVDTSGTSAHFVILDTVNSIILLKTETNAQAVVSNGTIDIPAAVLTELAAVSS